MPDLKARIQEACVAAGYRPDDDVLEELATHAAAAVDAAIAEGCGAAEIDRRIDALIDTWRADAARLRRRPREAAVAPPPIGESPWSGLVHDVRYGCRLLRRLPAFTALAVLTMTLGIGASVTLFSVTYGVLLRPLPWPDSDRLVRLTESRQGRSPRIRGTITNATFNAWRDRPDTIADIGGWRNIPTTALIGGRQEATRLQMTAVTPSLFSVLKATPFRGRLFVEDDGRSGASFAASDVVVLSYGLWQERFGGRDDAIGAIVQISGKPTTIVGVMPKEFAFPDRDTRAWMPWPIGSVIAGNGSRRMMIFSALARLRPGATPTQAAAEALRELAAHLIRASPRSPCSAAAAPRKSRPCRRSK